MKLERLIKAGSHWTYTDLRDNGWTVPIEVIALAIDPASSTVVYRHGTYPSFTNQVTLIEFCNNFAPAGGWAKLLLQLD